MRNKVLNLYFNLSLSTPLALVLEPSEDNDTWKKIHSIADKLIQSLPGRIEGIYFLGNTKCYPVPAPGDFRNHSPEWFNKNKGRVSLIGPILERLEKKDFKGTLAVICTASPVDADDWIRTEVRKRILFVRTQTHPFNIGFNEVYGLPGTGPVVEALENHPEEITVKGPGFVPVRWEIDPKMEVSVVYQDGSFRLKIIPDGERMELHIKAICGEILPSLFIERVRGDAQSHVAAKEEQPWFKEPEWKAIPQDIMPVIKAGLEKGDYTCPQCGREHRYNTLLCPEGDLVLRGMPLDTFLVFKNGTFLTLSELYALPLRDKTKIIIREGDMYEWQGGEWVSIGRARPFDEVDDGVWGLFYGIS